MINRKRRRAKAPAINAGSMADIAFLLLIFFLVTAEMNEQKVLKVKLPPWSEAGGTVGINAAILNIKLNAQGELLVDKEPARLAKLKMLVKAFINDPITDAGVRKEKGAGIISLQHESRTSYGKYIGVYDILQMAYAEIHEAQANIRFSKTWEDLATEQRNEILTNYPIKISEAEPFTSLK